MSKLAAPHPDAAAQARIRTALDATLFVEAGAGSGKTRALVDRIVALVATGTEIGAIAAITFTEKAAGELRDRVRRQLGAAQAEAVANRDDAVASRCRSALDDLDDAAVGTLHSFAHRILSEHPIEAGLPPRIEVFDEVASTVAFDERWTNFRDRLLEDHDVERALLLAESADVRLDALRAVALSFNQNWDLAIDRAPADAPDPPPSWTDGVPAILAAVEEIVAGRDDCGDGDDRLCRFIHEFEAWAARLREANDEYAQLALLRREAGRPDGSARRGNKANWPPGYDLDGLRARVAAVQDRCETLSNGVALAAVERLAVELRAFTIHAAEERRAEGQLEFHDLLVLARQMLRDPVHGARVRATLHDRYRHLLVDEFQDTDPIQIELVVLIASNDPDAGAKPWDKIEPAPGHLFFVGDPKQSIYRFRRADISLFLRAAARFGARGGGVTLTTNHRAPPSIVDWVNSTFGALITASTRGELPSQPAYNPSVAVRDDPAVGPPVAILGRDVHADGPAAAELRAREADQIAATVRRILAEGWSVDRSSDWRRPDWQAARPGHITVLVPTRTSLPSLEDALDAAGIAYRAEAASLVYSSRLIRDLLLTLRAIDDPTDELATVAALRSPLFGCGDDDLYSWRERWGGSFDITRPPPDDAPDGVVARGLGWLREVRADRVWASPSELVDRVVADRRVLELGLPDNRARDLWRRVRFVIDQARAWSEATGGTLRQYLEWVRHQTAEGGRVAEAVLPETDEDAIRVMTIHAAKGLQFPITIVAGLSTEPGGRRGGVRVAWPPGRCVISVGSKVRSEAFEEWRPVDEQMSHDERVRLLYVACTRARDHLVVSLHRKPPRNGNGVDPSRLTSAEVLAEALRDTLPHLPEAAPGEAPPPLESRSLGGAPGVPAYEDWRRTLDAALRTSAEPRTIAATALTDDGRPDAAVDPGLHKRPRDIDLPPWQKGRYGTAMGRAVHAVLQTIDLTTGAGLEEAVAAQAAAEGVVGLEDQMRALVEGALRAPTVVAAAASPHWRELYVAVPVARDRTIEGYVDLLYRSPDGLVVADYKTGPAGLDDDLDPLMARYRLQGASYALAVADATSEPVARMVFVFLTPAGAVERPLPHLAEAVADARRLIAAGNVTVVG